MLDATYGFIYDGIRYPKKDLDILEEVLTLNNLHILNFIDEISWNCSDLLFRCRFKDEIVPCDELFQVAHTFQGYCCSFNLNQSM